MSKRGRYVADWGKWHASISNKAWTEKNTSKRLELAKADLRAAGMPAEMVDNLTTGQLHSAWTHVPPAQQQIYMQARGTAARSKGKPKMQPPHKPCDFCLLAR